MSRVRPSTGAEFERVGSGNRLVTPRWLRKREAAVAALRYARESDPAADTSLIILGAQHPLVDGQFPNREFQTRLKAASARYAELAEQGRKAEFFLPGNRHHDSVSGQTDRVALYDAAARWLTNRDVPARDMHGKDWIDAYYPAGIYSGADEIRVAAAGFISNGRFEEAEYFCSSGQVSRAATYALAFGLPLTITVLETLEQDTEGQFHNNVQNLVLTGLTRAIDPYGDGVLRRVTRDRIPQDGNIGTEPDRLKLYQDLPWYA